MGLSRTVFEIDGDFSQKSQKNFHPFLLCVPAEGVPIVIGYRRWQSKNKNDGATGRQRSLTISSAVWIECTNVTDRQTDRRTPGHSNDRAYAQRRAVIKPFFKLVLHYHTKIKCSAIQLYILVVVMVVAIP